MTALSALSAADGGRVVSNQQCCWRGVWRRGLPGCASPTPAARPGPAWPGAFRGPAPPRLITTSQQGYRRPSFLRRHNKLVVFYRRPNLSLRMIITGVNTAGGAGRAGNDGLGGDAARSASAAAFRLNVSPAGSPAKGIDATGLLVACWIIPAEGAADPDPGLPCRRCSRDFPRDATRRGGRAGRAGRDGVASQPASEDGKKGGERDTGPAVPPICRLGGDSQLALRGCALPLAAR